MPLYSLTSFEIQKYCENEPTFNDVYSKNNFCKIKDGVYIKKLWLVWINTNSLDCFVCKC